MDEKLEKIKILIENADVKDIDELIELITLFKNTNVSTDQNPKATDKYKLSVSGIGITDTGNRSEAPNPHKPKVYGMSKADSKNATFGASVKKKKQFPTLYEETKIDACGIGNADKLQVLDEVQSQAESFDSHESNINVICSDNATAAHYDYDQGQVCVLLDLLNEILIENNRSKIDSIFDFVKIPRDEIIKCEHLVSLTSSDPNVKLRLKNIFAVFDKKQCGFYYKKNEFYIFNLIRGMCRQIGVEFKMTTRHLTQKIAKNICKNKHLCLYSLIKKS